MQTFLSLGAKARFIPCSDADFSPLGSRHVIASADTVSALTLVSKFFYETLEAWRSTKGTKSEMVLSTCPLSLRLAILGLAGRRPCRACAGIFEWSHVIDM